MTVKSVEGLDYAFEIENYDYLSSLQAMCNGEFYIQDSSSMLASEGNIIREIPILLMSVQRRVEKV